MHRQPACLQRRKARSGDDWDDHEDTHQGAHEYDLDGVERPGKGADADDQDGEGQRGQNHPRRAPHKIGARVAHVASARASKRVI